MKKFGLIVPEKKKPSPSNKVTTIFNEDDDSDEEKELSALRNAKKNDVSFVSKSISTSDKFVEKIHQEALNEDPNVFDYDAAVEKDRFNKGSFNEDELKNEPKYMKNILAKAEERKIESELIKLRNMKRKADTMDKNDEEEIFITSAYKEKLKELEEKEKELKARQIGEEEGDVTKRKDMSGFYYNLMKRNVSFGGKEIDNNNSKDSNDKKHEIIKEPVMEQPSNASLKNFEEEETIVFGPRRPPIKK